MAKKKRQAPARQQGGSKSPADVAAAFAAKNFYKYNNMTVQDSSVSPWDLRDSLIKQDPHNLYEVKSTADGDVVTVNEGAATIYAGNSAFSDNGKNALIVDDYIRGEIGGSSTHSSFVTIVLVVLIALVIIAAL